MYVYLLSAFSCLYGPVEHWQLEVLHVDVLEFFLCHVTGLAKFADEGHFDYVVMLACGEVRHLLVRPDHELHLRTAVIALQKHRL
jgi:hypothetical protein